MWRCPVSHGMASAARPRNGHILTRSVPIMREFLGGKYISELNRTNPLGRGGKLAEAFGGLMEKLWQVSGMLNSTRADATTDATSQETHVDVWQRCTHFRIYDAADDCTEMEY